MPSSTQIEMDFDQLNRRKDFAMYGEDTLLMMHHLTVMSDPEFFSRYTTPKSNVQRMVAELELVIARGDYVRRNEIFDYFLEVL